MTIPWHARLLLLAPRRVLSGLASVEEQRLVSDVPNLWQIELGVLRMWHRIVFRSETVGTCSSHPPRRTWRARLVDNRILRGPFLFWERAITPWDLSGFLADSDQIVRHLLGAHHDGTQFVYDLQLARLHPGTLERVREAAAHVVEVDDARSRWLRDLVVYEQYHESLLAAVEQVLAGADELQSSDADDPDISFFAYLRWCASQPATPADTWAAWRAGRFSFPLGLQPATVAELS